MRISQLSSLSQSHFIALMGQSNAVGYNQENPDPNTYNPLLGQYIYENNSQTWQQLQQNVNNSGSLTEHIGFQGIELKLMELLHVYYNSDQFLFKWGEGGTSLALNGIGVPYDWSPDSFNDHMYKSAVANFNSAVSLFPVQSMSCKVLIWIQGENDTNLEYANNYQTNFIKFITALKIAWNCPNLKVIQTGLSNTQTNYDPVYVNLINQAKINLSINGNKYVNTDGAESNGVHFTTAGYQDIAQRVFDVLITMI